MKNVKGILGFIALIGVVYIWNSENALRFTLEVSGYIWVMSFILSILVFLPSSFIKSAKGWCSNWFIAICFFQIIIFILTIKYLLLASGEMANLDEQRWPSPIMFIISLYRVTIGAGFDSYWQLIAMIAWGSACGAYGEKLDNQYGQYEIENRNNPGQSAKSKYVIVAVSTSLIILMTAVFMFSGRSKLSEQTKAKAVIASAMNEYKQSGMSGLRSLSEMQYAQLSKSPLISEIQKCAWIDMFGIMLNQQAIDKLKFPSDDYFNVKSFQYRIGKYLIQLGPMEKANQYLSAWELEVSQELKHLEKEL